MDARAVAGFAGQPAVTAQIKAHAVTFAVPGQTEAGRLQIQIGDYKDGVNVAPMLRPELQALTAALHPPAYLHHPDETNTLQTPHLQVVQGTRVSLEARISRDLSDAQVVSTNTINVRRSGPSITTQDLIVDAPQNITLRWTDTYGLSGDRPYTVKISTIADEAPFVDCRGASRAIAILEDEVVDFDLASEDDFGIRKLWVAWKTLSGEFKDKADGAGQADIEDGAYTRRHLAGKFSFSPLTAHVPEDSVISLSAYASDYYPDREPSVSPEIRIYVLSRAQHADLVMKQMENVHAQVEEITRIEEELVDSNKDLAGKPPEALANPESREVLRENEATERRQSERLEDLANQTQELVEEAIRNADIAESTIAKWAELLAAMKDVSEQAMQQAAKSLQKAGDQTEQRKEELEKAIAKEEEAIQKLQEAASEMDKSLEEMMAESFVNRLRQAAEREQLVSEELAELLPKTLGLDVASIPADVGEAISLVAGRQVDTRKQVGYVQDDLAGFYSRTRVEQYNVVYMEMRTMEVVGALERLGELIRGNIAVQAISEAKKWSAQLSAWADALTPPKKEGDAKGGEGGAEGLEAEDMEVLIALMRTRKLEEGLRRQTRLLDESRETNRRYHYDARKLGHKQDELASATRPIERRVRNPKLRQLIEKIGGEMMNASMLLQAPKTDHETIAIQTEIIELLSNSIDSASDSQGGSSASQKLAQMMPKQGQKPSQKPGQKPGQGESGSGGSGEGSASGQGAGSTAQGASERQVERASGMSRETPQEFRDVLEAYFQALEDKP
ncbi:MAG: hypothetical protein O3C57_00220 [Verrucomicrobia bacterium]|nr:hypothetical protein [Verrucomicrobiota bacterium]